MQKSIYLYNLESCPTRHREPQLKTLDFLASIHQQSAQYLHDSTPVRKLLLRYGVKDNYIGSRGFECGDIYVPESDRTLYKVTPEKPAGANIQERTDFFRQRAEEVIDSFYTHKSNSPDHIIHVTCTGYVSPSAPQKLVSKRNWTTEITHAYHMGCYAAIPAIRIAIGQVLRGKKVDIVHNEMCSLHLNPSLQTPEQLVVQTLFADGHIFYQVSDQTPASGFKVLTLKEKIIPGTESDMAWMPSSFGMSMNLSREVPKKIEEHIRDFTTELIAEAGLPFDRTLKDGIFAIHPGGPKIVETVSQSLELKESQYQSSKEILFEHGNMSSATLPHIWERILSSNVDSGTPVISLAFGPGLTVFGTIFEIQK